ncbi:MAG: hypothetical protein ACI9WU_003622, partial [Myxococcota bacterium]
MPCFECGQASELVQFCGACGAAWPSPPALRLALDKHPVSHFQAGARCLLRFRIGADVPVQAVALTISLTQTLFFEPAALGALADVPLEHEQWWVPELAGLHQLCGTLEARDDDGNRWTYTLDPTEFLVGGLGTSTMQVINIDQSRARVVDNSRSRFGQSRFGDREGPGGLVQASEWVEIPVAAQRVDMRSRPRAGLEITSVHADDLVFAIHTAFAEGDLTTVYRGVDGQGDEVAIKLATDRADNDLLLREARVLAALHRQDSPQRKHLPTLLARITSEDGRAGNVLSWCDGMDLYAVRERFPEGVPVEPATWIWRRALSALGHAHNVGVVHCNIEPAHILVRPSDHNVFLVDWCYASVRPGQTGDGFVARNESFSPPEVAERRPPIPASDLYSLGASILWLLGGDPATG